MNIDIMKPFQTIIMSLCFLFAIGIVSVLNVSVFVRLFVCLLIVYLPAFPSSLDHASLWVLAIVPVVLLE